MAKRGGEPDAGEKAFNEGLVLLRSHPIFQVLLRNMLVVRGKDASLPPDGLCYVTAEGTITAGEKARATPEAWAFAIGHCALHLAFGHFPQQHPQREWNAACCQAVNRYLTELRVGRPTEGMAYLPDYGSRDEQVLFQRFTLEGLPERADGCGAAGRSPDMREGTSRRVYQTPNFVADFSEAIAAAVADALDGAAGGRWRWGETREIALARASLINTFPLLGGLLAGLRLVEDQHLCMSMDISIAAISCSQGVVYLNPAARLTDEQWRFVLAHEALHAGLCHEQRRQGRDPYLWNVACDYVINGWLVEMKVGHMPPQGALHDKELAGLSAEAIYDTLVTDLRRARKLMGFAREGDMLPDGPPGWWSAGEGLTLDGFYRRALMQGLSYHQQRGRGPIPAGLVEEIRALDQPPIPWDVALAQWFDHQFPPEERRRSYARPSRRQAQHPEIPLPRYVPPPDELPSRTFGVLLDTSGSMATEDLARALGAIASYSLAREVAMVRLVFCDAQAYDQGYVAPETLLEVVSVHGRGGTVLQPGLELLERAEDFPADAPVLIITDGACDVLTVRREHAFLMPPNGSLPFAARGPIFRIQ